MQGHEGIPRQVEEFGGYVQRSHKPPGPTQPTYPSKPGGPDISSDSAKRQSSVDVCMPRTYPHWYAIADERTHDCRIDIAVPTTVEPVIIV